MRRSWRAFSPHLASPLNPMCLILPTLSDSREGLYLSEGGRCKGSYEAEQGREGGSVEDERHKRGERGES